jgi:carbon storage regulator
MLVITRRKNESVMIGDDIEIIVLDEGTRVRLGVFAPEQLSVNKKELYETIPKEKIVRYEPGAGKGANYKSKRTHIITRKIDESIMIGDDIEIMIVDVRIEGVRLGFRVEKQLSVYRKEIWENIQKGIPKPPINKK